MKFTRLPNRQQRQRNSRGAKGKFWEMHDGIFENQATLGVPFLLEFAQSLGLAEQELLASLESHTYIKRVKDDFLGGVRSGVNGTPTFFINGQRHDGPFEYEDLVAAIEARSK